jgi:hypothetical protein
MTKRKKKTATEKKKTKELTSLSPWLSSELAYRVAGFDSDDVYVFSFSIDGAGDLSVDVSGTAGDGGVTVTAAGIASATDRLEITQGDVTNGGSCVGTTPQDAFLPFLLSRELFAELRSGEAIHWPSPHVGVGEGVEVKKTGAGTMVVNVNGKKTTVKTIEADGYEVSLTILDDAEWPIVLVDEEADDCGWWLKKVGNNLDADEVHESGDDEDEDDEDEDDEEDEEEDDED